MDTMISTQECKAKAPQVTGREPTTASFLPQMMVTAYCPIILMPIIRGRWLAEPVGVGGWPPLRGVNSSRLGQTIGDGLQTNALWQHRDFLCHNEGGRRRCTTTKRLLPQWSLER